MNNLKKKKHRFRRPQIRKRLKPTVGKLEFVDVVYMAKEVDDDGVTQIYATCTCDKWRSSPEATTIQKVALEAKEHVQSGPCVFRPHSPDQNPYVNGIGDEEISNEDKRGTEQAGGVQDRAGSGEEPGDTEGQLRQGGSEGGSTGDAGGNGAVGSSESG